MVVMMILIVMLSESPDTSTLGFSGEESTTIALSASGPLLDDAGALWVFGDDAGALVLFGDDAALAVLRGLGFGGDGGRCLSLRGVSTAAVSICWMTSMICVASAQETMIFSCISGHLSLQRRSQAISRFNDVALTSAADLASVCLSSYHGLALGCLSYALTNAAFKRSHSGKNCGLMRKKSAKYGTQKMSASASNAFPRAHEPNRKGAPCACLPALFRTSAMSSTSNLSETDFGMQWNSLDLAGASGGISTNAW